MNDFVEPQLRDMLERVLYEMNGSNPDIDFERLKDDFVFHLTECIDNLDMFVRLCKSPAAYDPQSAERIIHGLLYHAVGHLISACRKYDYVPDPFKELDAQPATDKQLKKSQDDIPQLS